MPNYIRFRSYLIVELGITPRSADSYVADIKRFYNATSIEIPTRDDAVSYLMTFYEKGLSYSHTVNNILSLEHYFKFNGKNEKFERPKKPKTRVEDWLTEQEMARLFCFCKNIREQTIIAMLAYTGIRNFELCDLLVKNINFESQTIFIKAGKGLKDGVVCVAPNALSIIANYLKEYPRSSDQTLLFSVTGKRTDEKMRTCAIRKHIKVIVKRAGINRRIYPHLFRHSLAMNLLLRGADLYTVKEQLRHEFISTTEIYIKSNPQILRNNYPIFVPQYVWGVPTFQKGANQIFAGCNTYKFNK